MKNQTRPYQEVTEVGIEIKTRAIGLDVHCVSGVADGLEPQVTGLLVKRVIPDVDETGTVIIMMMQPENITPAAESDFSRTSFVFGRATRSQVTKSVSMNKGSITITITIDQK